MKKKIRKPTDSDRNVLRMLVRSRREFQEQRKRIDNRLGFKADHSQQNVSERMFEASDAMLLERVSKAARQQEDAIQKDLLTVLKRFPVWNEWLSQVKGVGPIAGATIIAEIKKGGTAKKLPWSEASKAHRDRAARRKMIKAFLQDLYVAWRELEHLPVREPYVQEYLGRKHEAA